MMNTNHVSLKSIYTVKKKLRWSSEMIPIIKGVRQMYQVDTNDHGSYLRSRLFEEFRIKRYLPNGEDEI